LRFRQYWRSSTRLPFQNIDQSGAASRERQITRSLEGRAMQTPITTTKSKWLETQEALGAVRLDTVTAILSIFAIVAAVTIAITAFANIQMGSVG
jgi:hypothetical protein